MTYHHLVVSRVSSTRNGFSLVEQVLSPIRDLLVTTKVRVPPLHSYGSCGMLVVDVVHKCYSWVGLLVAPLI